MPISQLANSHSPNQLISSSSNQLILFAAADCTGHGVPGAMVSVVCHNALNRSVKEFGLTEPGKILDKTKELVVETFTKSNADVKDGMDISLCSIKYQVESIKTEENSNFEISNSNCNAILQWAGANNPLWVVRSVTSRASVTDSSQYSILTSQYSLQEFKADKQPIGKTFHYTHVRVAKRRHRFSFHRWICRSIWWGERKKIHVQTSKRIAS